MPVSMSIPEVPHSRAVACTACTACTRPAFFQARVESPAGREFIARRVNACAGHLAEVIQRLRAWARCHDVARGRLTVLAIDPYALPRLAALGIADPGFAFYSAPVTEEG
jgi:hypothetical protein